ncbi:hypothetical protein CGLO_18046 [Colletotrichum gloeosporioides Cg-14]|uniref:Uncharacterized protein n=1 Tax=Colletotrichum gloeosporioides (strain Cg-14) TaxID=1237896 RepID=T0JV83_COLGC|nr:hypothetical protein CGLO_18046 [Colletotrichum gloeosporioides Cg-14]
MDAGDAHLSSSSIWNTALDIREAEPYRTGGLVPSWIRGSLTTSAPVSRPPTTRGHRLAHRTIIYLLCIRLRYLRRLTRLTRLITRHRRLLSRHIINSSSRRHILLAQPSLITLLTRPSNIPTSDDTMSKSLRTRRCRNTIDTRPRPHLRIRPTTLSLRETQVA